MPTFSSTGLFFNYFGILFKSMCMQELNRSRNFYLFDIVPRLSGSFRDVVPNLPQIDIGDFF